MASSVSCWSDLPQDLLHLVIAGLTSPADCARFRAVCRSWRRVPSPRRLPWLVLPDGFLRYSPPQADGSVHVQVQPFPHNNTRCVGATDTWLAIAFVDTQTRARTTRLRRRYKTTSARTRYYLYNYFSGATLCLTELEEIIGDVVSKPRVFEVRKVLMDSPPTGLVALRTSSYHHPLILLQPGKGAWLPDDPQTALLLSRVIDIAFFQDKLYGITQAEDLISFSITFDTQGLPTLTDLEFVVKHQQLGGDPDHVVSQESRNSGTDDDYIVHNGWRLEELGDEEKRPTDKYEGNLTIWYLVESRGRLLMVRRRLFTYEDECFTCKVEVFKADAGVRKWLPLPPGGLDGQALFISKRFSKSVFASGEVKEDTIYFADTANEVFDMISNTAAPTNIFNVHATCLFLPGSF